MAQVATIILTWTAWKVRDTPINLPWIEAVPQFSIGWLICLSLAWLLTRPDKSSLSIYLGLLLLAFLQDQFRCQPQVLVIAVLTCACILPNARLICVWFLAAMWAWAGIHKLLSPEWPLQVHGFASTFNDSWGVQWPLIKVYFPLAISIAGSELLLGFLAWLRPRYAIALMIPLHLGILISLILIGWNWSVVPWNVCLLIVAPWLLWTSLIPDKNVLQTQFQKHQFRKHLRLPPTVIGKCMVVALLVTPIGLYFGWVRYCFAHSYYSGNLPVGVVSHDEEPTTLVWFPELGFFFPVESGTCQQYFRKTARRGDKLHVHRPMRGWDDQYFFMDFSGQVRELNEAKFLEPTPLSDGSTAPPGLANDPAAPLFKLIEAGWLFSKKKSQTDMVYAAECVSDSYDSKHLLLLKRLRNLEQIQLQNCPVSDADLQVLADLPKLTGLGLNGTQITDEGVKQLRHLPHLTTLQADNTAVTEAGLKNLGLNP